MDMTQAEQRSQLGLFDMSKFESNTEEFDFIPDSNSNPQRALADVSFSSISAKYPDPPAKLSSFSHVKSFPTPKNQGGCGSCWVLLFSFFFFFFSFFFISFLFLFFCVYFAKAFAGTGIAEVCNFFKNNFPH